MAYKLIEYIVMAYIVMEYIVMAYIYIINIPSKPLLVLEEVVPSTIVNKHRKAHWNGDYVDNNKKYACSDVNQMVALPADDARISAEDQYIVNQRSAHEC